MVDYLHDFQFEISFISVARVDGRGAPISAFPFSLFHFANLT